MQCSFNGLLDYFKRTGVKYEAWKCDEDGVQEINTPAGGAVTVEIDGRETMVSGFILSNGIVQIYIVGDDVPYTQNADSELKFEFYIRIT